MFSSTKPQALFKNVPSSSQGNLGRMMYLSNLLQTCSYTPLEPLICSLGGLAEPSLEHWLQQSCSSQQLQTSHTSDIQFKLHSGGIMAILRMRCVRLCSKPPEPSLSGSCPSKGTTYFLQCDGHLEMWPPISLHSVTHTPSLIHTHTAPPAVAPGLLSSSWQMELAVITSSLTPAGSVIPCNAQILLYASVCVYKRLSKQLLHIVSTPFMEVWQRGNDK